MQAEEFGGAVDKRSSRPGLLSRLQGLQPLKFAAACLALAAAILPPMAQAQFATGGTGLHKGRIFWVDWGTPGENVYNGKTITRGFNVDTPASPANRLDITCTLSNATTTRNTVTPGGTSALSVYVPGTWQGDGLDDLYNIGGAVADPDGYPVAGNPNTLSTGLAVNGGTTVEFDFNCSATLGGQAFPLNGLVFADSEASGGIEYVAARLTRGGTLRIIDSIAKCGNPGTVSVSGSPSEIQLVPGALGSCETNGTPSLRAGPVLVGFIDGALGARVIAQGGGVSAVAVGVVLELEFSEAIPNTYGVATHILDATWSGGVATTGVDYVQRGNLATFAYAAPQLGRIVLPDADANGAIGGPDVDSLPKTTGPAGGGYASVAQPTARGAPYVINNVTCTGPGVVAGWIDFNGNGTFDAGEKSGNVNCPSGFNTISLTWTTPSGTAYVAQPTSYMRLRAAPNAAGVASPTGIVSNGETEDYRLNLPPLLADMVVGFNSFPTNPPAGSTVTGNVTCTNAGPDPAANATCNVPTANLPAGATVTCTPAPVPNPLPVGQAISCAVSFTAPGAGGVTIQATTTTTTPDPVSPNNTSSTPLTFAPQADMQGNTTVPANAVAGQPVTVSGTCTNAGPSAAAAPTCVLSGLPAGATQSCTPSPAPDPLAVGAAITCTSTFNAPATGAVNITTTAGSTSADPAPANNAKTLPLAVAPQADMAATVSGFPSNPPAGSTATGTITCTNNGPSAAASPTCNVGSTPAGATVTCTPNPAPNPLAVGQSISCAVSYTVPASGGITITGTAGSATADPVPSNNTAQASSSVTPQADMEAVTTVPASATAGQPVTVSGSCTNKGPSTAASPTCALSGLPAGATQSCTPNPAPNPLAVGSAITCTSTFTAPGTGPLTIATTAGSGTADPITSNNTDTKPLTVTPQADLAAAVSAFPASPAAGSTVTGTVTCTNNGPSTASNANCVVGGLPAGATVNCSPAVPAANLAVGSAVTCSVSYTAPASGTVTVTGTASSSTADPLPANNTAQATQTVAPQADMRAATTIPASATAGQPVTVTGVCSNAGPSPAAAPTCALSGLPAGATQTCTPSPAPNPLPVGQSITCTSSFNAPASGALNITTTAGTSTPDPVAGNNADTKPLAVSPQADMQAVASGFPVTAIPGEPVNGTVTCTNNGPSPADNPTCSVNTLPASGIVVCAPDPAPNPLPVGQSITCQVSFNGPPKALPVTITGVASSSTPDPTPNNNRAQASTNTAPLADMAAATTVPAAVAAGQSVTVSGTCTNNGPIDATDPACTLSGLPPGASTSCTPAPTPNPLPLNGVITCTSTFTAPASGPLNITTTAGSLTADGVPANNVDTKPIAVTAQADMQATISGFPANPPAGSTVSGTVTCVNKGPSVAADATCLATGAPAGATVICSPSSPVSFLGVGSAMSCSVSYTAPAGGGPVTITGTAGSATADPVPANNTANATSNVAAQADMRATLSSFPSNPPAGSTVTGTATCTNAGPSAAATPTCVLTGLPAGATVTCTPNPVPNPLAVGAAITCSVSFQVPVTGTVNVTATAGSATPDPVPGNNAATAPLTVGPVADMQAAVSGFPPNAPAGTAVTGTVTCTNNGPSPATGANCGVGGTPAGATVSCAPNPAPNPLPVGQAITCTVSYTAATSGAVTVTGTATSATPDPIPANNTASAQTGVIDAVNDSAAAPVNGLAGGLAIPNVLSNDTVNGAPVVLANVTLRQTATTSPGVTLNPATGAVSVAPNTPAGTYVVTYEICTRTAPAACDTATATVTVGAAPIDAVNDPQLVVGPTGASINLFANDTLNGAPFQPALVTAQVTNAGGLNGLTIDANGNLVVPPGAPPGSYTVTYQICEKLNPANCDTATVPVVVQGLLTGSAWLDAGASGVGGNDRQRNPGETGLPGWTVEVVYPPGNPQAGQVVKLLNGQPATAVTDASGQYQLAGLPPGNYQLRFRAPGTAGQPGAIYGTPANGEQNNPQAGSTVNPATRTLDITMPAGAGLAQQSLPVDPSGVIYDTVTRQPVVGATVTLLGPNGQPVPVDQLLPGQQGQAVIATGPAAGSYRFDLLPTAPAGTYTIQVTAPTGYTFQSNLIPPTAGPGTPGAGGLCPGATTGKACPVQPQSAPPAVGASTTYYLTLNLTPSASPDVVNNNIPLDPATSAVLAIIKTANKTEAEIGDPVRYTIRVKNLATSGTIPAVQVVDRLPLGFKYVPKTTRGTGTPPVVLPEPAGSPGPQLTFNVGAIAAGAEVTFNYFVRIGVLGADGDGVNRATAVSGSLRSLTAEARVKVRGGVFGSDSCVIGKVFVDCGADGVGYGNGNGIQDPGEPGIPGVRLYLQDGSYVITDSEGKYSLCGLPPKTQVLKVDPVTLPKGARLGTTANRNAGDPGSLFIDVKNGELHRADFRDMSCNASVFDEVKRRREAAPKGAQEDVNRPRIEGQGQPGSGLGLPPGSSGNGAGNTTGATPGANQYGKEGQR